MAIDTTLDQVEALYIGYFGRAAEPDGAQYWATQLNSGAMTWAQVAASFSVQAETLNQYPYLAHPDLVSPADFVNQVYQNLFHRAADTDGLNYWVEQLNGRHDAASIGQFILDVINGAYGENGSPADQATIENKIDAAEYFTQHLASAGIGGTHLENGHGVLDDNVITPAHDAVSGVTNDASTISSSEAATDAFVGEAAHLGQTFGLSPAIDIFNFDNGHATSGNDTYIATLTGDATNTYTTGDNIDGGSGIDTFKILATDSTNEANQVTLNHIEKVSVQATTGVNLDASQWHDVTTYELLNTNSNTTVYIGDNSGTEIQQAFTTVNFTNVSQGGSGDELDLYVADGVFAGNNDTVTVNLNRAGSVANGDNYADFYLENYSTGDSVIENYVVNSVAASTNDVNYLYLNDTEVTQTLTINGPAAVSLTLGYDDALTKIDASGNSGGVDLWYNDTIAAENAFTYTGSTGVDQLGIYDNSASGVAITVSTGEGNDLVEIDGAHGTAGSYTVDLGAGNDILEANTYLKAGDTVSGGDGTDTLNVTNGTAFTAALLSGVSNFEVLDVSGGQGTYDLSILSGAFSHNVSIVQGIDGGLSGATTLSKAADGFVLDIESGHNADTLTSVDHAITGNFSVGQDITISMATDTASNTATVNLISTDGSLASHSASGLITTNGIIANDVETLTLHSNIDQVDTGLHAASDYVNTIGTLTDGDLTTLNITGNEGLTITNELGATNANLAKIDASGSSGNITLNYSADAHAVQYLGSSGVDTITTSNGGSINGGMGNDQITLTAAGTNQDTLYYQAATDAQVSVDATGKFVSTSSTVETITNFVTSAAGGASHDVLDFSAYGATGTAAGAISVTMMAGLTSGNFASSQTDFFKDAGGNHLVAFSTDGTDTYVFVDANHDGNFNATADSVIKLAGVNDLGTADFHIA